MKTTGEKIRELRIRQSLTLEDVARYLGVGRQAVHKYEQGTVTNIPLENIEKMAALFGTTPGYLAGWSDSDPSGSDRLSSDETLLIDTYRSVSANGKRYLLQQAQIARITFGEKTDASASDVV